MRYILRILFFSVTAFAQQDSLIVKLPNNEFLKTLQAQVPGINIPTIHINTYRLTQADKDSVYKAAFDSPEVQLAIKNKFKYNGQLLSEGFEVEVLSVLMSREVSSDRKKQLLMNRILADRNHEGQQYVAPTAIIFVTDTIHSRDLAMANYLAAAHINFARCLYIIDGAPYAAESIENLQSLFVKLSEMEINIVVFMTGEEGAETNMSGERPSYGIIIIRSKN